MSTYAYLLRCRTCGSICYSGDVDPRGKIVRSQDWFSPSGENPASGSAPVCPKCGPVNRPVNKQLFGLFDAATNELLP